MQLYALKFSKLCQLIPIINLYWRTGEHGILASCIAFEVSTGEQWRTQSTQRTGEHGILASCITFEVIALENSGEYRAHNIELENKEYSKLVREYKELMNNFYYYRLYIYGIIFLFKRILSVCDGLYGT